MLRHPKLHLLPLFFLVYSQLLSQSIKCPLLSSWCMKMASWESSKLSGIWGMIAFSSLSCGQGCERWWVSDISSQQQPQQAENIFAGHGTVQSLLPNCPIIRGSDVVSPYVWFTPLFLPLPMTFSPVTGVHILWDTAPAKNNVLV